MVGSPFVEAETLLIISGGFVLCAPMVLFILYLFFFRRNTTENTDRIKAEVVVPTIVTDSCDNAIPTLFLRGFGAVYVCAFMSYWLQYPGLFGDDGLGPTEVGNNSSTCYIEPPLTSTFTLTPPPRLIGSKSKLNMEEPRTALLQYLTLEALLCQRGWLPRSVLT